MMYARLVPLMLIAGSMLLSGCGGGSEKTEEYEQLLQQIVDKADELTGHFESIQNKRSAGQAVDKIIQTANELSQLISKAGELPSLGALDGMHMKKRYENHWKAKLRETFQAVETAAQAAAGRAENHRGMLRVDTRMQQLRQQLKDFEQAYQNK